MVKIPKKVKIKVRVFNKDPVEFKYGYFELYPDISTDVYYDIPKRDRKDIETLIKDLDDTEYVDVQVDIQADKLLTVQDNLNIKLYQECVRLSEENIVIYNFLREQVAELEEFMDEVPKDAVLEAKWNEIKRLVR